MNKLNLKNINLQAPYTVHEREDKQHEFWVNIINKFFYCFNKLTNEFDAVCDILFCHLIKERSWGQAINCYLKSISSKTGYLH